MEEPFLIWAEKQMNPVPSSPIAVISEESLPVGYIDKLFEIHKKEIELNRILDLELCKNRSIIALCEALEGD